jgi:hypothetical protein
MEGRGWARRGSTLVHETLEKLYIICVNFSMRY